MKTVQYLLVLLLFVFSLPVLANPQLQAAKQQGLVGETPTGYLAAVKPPSPEIEKLIESINARRRQQYSQIAKKRGVPLAEVEKLAGKKAIEKSKPGHYIQVNGTWKKK